MNLFVVDRPVVQITVLPGTAGEVIVIRLCLLGLKVIWTYFQMLKVGVREVGGYMYTKVLMSPEELCNTSLP